MTFETWRGGKKAAIEKPQRVPIIFFVLVHLRDLCETVTQHARRFLKPLDARVSENDSTRRRAASKSLVFVCGAGRCHFTGRCHVCELYPTFNMKLI